MGWAGPADWVEPKNFGLGRSQPNTSFSFYRWAGSGPYIWAGPHQVRPTRRVNYMQNVNSSSRCACNSAVADGGEEWKVTLRRDRSCCHWPGVKWVEVLVEEMVAWVDCGGCSWKRKKRKKSAEGRGRRKSRLLLLKEGVWAATYGGNDGFHTADGGGGCSRRIWRKKWWRCWFPVAEEERRRSWRRKSAAGRGRKAGFLAYFGPDFLLSQTMKSASIYRR